MNVYSPETLVQNIADILDNMPFEDLTTLANTLRGKYGQSYIEGPFFIESSDGLESAAFRAVLKSDTFWIASGEKDS